MSNAFREWVLKHDIGPGMNDNREKVKNYSGFDGSVGDGWVPILDRLATDLIALGWDRDLHQVKEKFGGLRFYIGASTDEIDKRIKQAEAECWKTCEDCGNPGKRRGGGWIRVLCEGCEKKRKSA